jgi:hypothetical protein
MEPIQGNVSDALGDIIIAVAEVVLDMALEQHGPISVETSTEIAGALGRAMDGVCKKASAGVYSKETT